MKNLWLYLVFWWRSTNQHGIHSPFVFALVTKCFYAKKKYKAYNKLCAKTTDFKKAKFLCRFLDYFNFDTIYHPEFISKNFKIALSSNPDSVVKTYSGKIPKITNFKQKQLIYFKSLPLDNSEEFQQFMKQCSNDSIIIIEDIRQSFTQFQYWKQLKSNPLVRVSIDTYWFGILCFRKEQNKEHFTIRL